MNVHDIRIAHRFPASRLSGRLVGALMGCAALSLMCVPAASAATARSVTKTSNFTLQIALSGPPTNSGGIFEIADYKGFFTREHLNVVVTAFNGGPPIVEAEEAGKIDLGEYAPSTSVETYNTSDPLVTVGVEAGRSVEYAVVSTSFLTSEGYTPET
jgi:ABC-type nitrate/sulfonate/bicarbonate transport system substrate-binding protein